MYLRIGFALATFIAVPSMAAAPAAAVSGRWKTDDGKAIVAMAPCGTKMCGRIERLPYIDPIDLKFRSHVRVPVPSAAPSAAFFTRSRTSRTICGSL